MSTDSTGLPANQIERPAYLANVPAYDLSQMNQYARPPRLTVVQALSGPPLKPPFREGDIIVTPQMIKVGDEQTPFSFTPIIFFVDFLCMNPVQMRGQLPFIRERSFDPNSTVAKKARAFVKEPCPENKEHQIKYVQNLNFVCIIHSEDISEMPIAMSFNRGTFKVGQSMIGLIQDRRGAPPYVIRLRGITRIIPGKPPTSFPGLDIKNDPSPWVEESQVERFKLLHDNLQQLVSTGQMDIDLNGDDLPSDDPANETKF